jgi:hypothetical protein
MRLIAVSIVLIIAALTVFGQDRSPRHIRSTIYRIETTATDAKPDTSKYAYSRYYTKDGTDCTSEVMGFLRDPGVVKYDDRGNVIERNRFMFDGDLLSRQTYLYDDQNRMIEMRTEDEHTDLITRDVLEYDQAGNKIRSEKFDAGGNSVIKTLYQYDSLANQTHYTEYKNGKFDIQYIHTYDPDGNLIKKQWLDTLDQCYNWSTFGYNDQGEPLYECTFDENDSLVYKKEYLYTYDSVGSWIERREYENDRLKQFIQREITYYE